MNDIGNRLKYFREEYLNMNQRDFAKQMGISQPALAMFEKGDRELKEIHVKRICDEFDINKDWLCNGVGGRENMLKKTDVITKAFAHFGYIMEHSSPQKIAALSAMIGMIDCVPDEKWDYIVNTFQEAYKQAMLDRQASEKRE